MSLAIGSAVFSPDEPKFWFAWAVVAMQAIFVAWLAWDVLYLNSPARREKRLEKRRQQLITGLDRPTILSKRVKRF
ncbi:hypothetical protein LCGC14_2777230 [marine sediment metagenome]|uniref:Uncharacterized protein n=1 Tax=marine sediment metagenome TaxID=412755 RepID=A0A0F8YUD5_9ZZZZ